MTTQYGANETHSDSGSSQRVAGGFVLFATITLALVGALQFLEGLVAVADDKFYVVARNYTYEFDVTTWGWIHMVVGIVALIASFGLLSGAVWARALGIVLAVISALVNFAWLPYYPLWALVVITLNIVVIWAITRYDPAA